MSAPARLLRPPGSQRSHDEASPAEEPRSTLGYAIFALIAVGLGTAIRLLVIGQSTFPLGAGGLFYVMVRDLEAHRFALPSFTSYNGGTIPFAYPPLGFYLVAALNTTTGAPVLTLFRLVPVALTCLSIGAFALLARSLLSERAAIAATLAFALIPDSFAEEIKGGGVTRAPGQLFAILAVWQLTSLYRAPTWRSRVAAAAFGSLALLSHVEWGEFVALTALLLFLFRRRSPSGLAETALFAAGVGILTAPWWVHVVALHGMSPFVAALTGNAAVYPLSSSLANLLTLTLTHESWFALGTMLALVGLLSCVGRGLWFLPVWLAAAELIDARGQMVTLILPVALLVGVGIVDVILPLALADRGADRPRRPVMLVVALVCAVLLVRSLFSTMLYAATQDAAMPAPERTAMAWVSGDTPVGSRFLVYASTSNANTDDVEWFPALTGRISLVTSQGQEWVKGEYARRTRETIALIHCGPELACVQRTLRRFDLHPQYVYLGKPVQHVLCEGLCLSMRQSPGYTLVYDGPGAWIFRLRPG